MRRCLPQRGLPHCVYGYKNVLFKNKRFQHVEFVFLIVKILRRHKHTHTYVRMNKSSVWHFLFGERAFYISVYYGVIYIYGAKQILQWQIMCPLFNGRKQCIGTMLFALYIEICAVPLACARLHFGCL